MSDTENRWQGDLALIADAAKQAGLVALGFFNKSPEVWWKNEDRSPVSAADFAANETLEAILRKARPDYGWLSEETEDDSLRLRHETLFIVDPIDGTRAFLAGKDLWCVSVGIVHRGRPVAGALYAPALDELYEAAEDGPALKNGQQIAVSGRGTGDISQFAISEEYFKKLPVDVRERSERFQYIPSLAYRIAMVADGRLDMTAIRKDAHDWDMAAADLILERAGGRLADLWGRPTTYNRPDVSHDVLCAAPAARLQEYLDLFTHLRDG